MKKTVLSVGSILLALVLAACTGSTGTTNTTTATTAAQAEDQTKAAATEAEETVLEGRVVIIGSTSVEKIGIAIADAFMAENPGVTVTYEGVGSSAGIKAAAEGTADIGTASRALKDQEKEMVAEQVIAYDGVAVIVHPDNPAADLSVEQVQKIYKGEITDWSEVGGTEGKIVVVSREDGSGTRGAFEEIVGFANELTGTALIAEGNGNVQQMVAGNPLAIGYVSFSYLNEKVKGLKIEGAEPAEEAVLDGSYKISRPFLMVYKEDNLKANQSAEAFLEYVLSQAGQDLVTANHGIRVDGK